MSESGSTIDKSDSSSFEDLGVVNDTAENTNDEKITKPQNEEWMDVLGSGNLMKKVTKEGDEDEGRPERNDICRISFEGRLKNGTVIEKQDNLEVQLGDGDVIQGIDLVLRLMYIGEICELKISPRFGFGEVGMAPHVLPNSELEYTVEMLGFVPEPDLETLSIKERKAIGNKKRERGNWWYSMQEPALAIQSYRRAIEYLDETKGGITDPTPDGELVSTTDELHSLLSDRIKVYNNMAAAQMKIGSFEAALHSVETVISCQPDNVKALFRKGKILSQKNDVEGALQAIRAAIKLSPEEKSLLAELAKLEAREKKDGQRERDLARKMMGSSDPKDKKPADKNPKPKDGGGKKKMLLWGTAIFTVAIGVISIVVYRYKMMQ